LQVCGPCCVEPVALVVIVRGPLLAALFIAAVLSGPDQLHDLYRVDLDDLLDGKPLRPLLGLLGVIACSAVISLLARHLAQSNSTSDLSDDAGGGPSRPLLAAMPVLCGAIIPAALALGLERSARQHGASSEFVTHEAAVESAALAHDIAVAITASTQLLRVLALVVIGVTV
jgi:hypothetical protein